MAQIGYFLARVKLIPITISLRGVSHTRQAGLSWSGVAWRSAIALLVTIFSMMYWFSFVERANEGCSDQIYFFGQRAVNANLTFLRISSTLILFPVGYLLSIWYQLLLGMLRLIWDFAFRYCVVRYLEALSPGLWDALADYAKQLVGVWAVLSALPMFGSSGLAATLDVMLEHHGVRFWTIKKDELSPVSELIESVLPFFSRGNDSPGPIEGEPGKISRVETWKSVV